MDYKDVTEVPNYRNLAYMCMSNVFNSFRNEFTDDTPKNIFAIITDFKETILEAMRRTSAGEVEEVRNAIQSALDRVENVTTKEKFLKIVDEIEVEFIEFNKELFNELAKAENA